MDMNIIDIAIIAILAISVLIGFWRGFFDELFTLIGFAISVVASLFLYPYLGQTLAESFKFSIGLANLIGFLVIFVGVEIIWTIISGIILRRTLKPLVERWNQNRAFKIINRLLGLINGFIAINIIIINLVILPLSPALKSTMSDSKFTPFLLNKFSFFDQKIENLLAPAEKETRAKIDNLLGAIFPGENQTISFPGNLELTINYNAEKRMLELINAERSKQGLGSLIADPALSAIARKHSLEMFKLSYFDHNSPVTGTPTDRLLAAKINFKTAGENLAYAPDVEVAHNGLMNSPGHRANILSPNFHKIGIGIISADNWGEMFTQEFTD